MSPKQTTTVELDSQCLHCIVTRIVEEFRQRGDSERQAIGDLCQVLAQIVESMPAGPEWREAARAFVLENFAQACKEAREGYDSGNYAPAATAGETSEEGGGNVH